MDSRGEFYHVAPASAREAIMEHGLMGHLRNEDVEHSPASPWAGKMTLGQPPGNYMFDNPAAAQEYAWSQGIQAMDKGHGEIMSPDEWWEHGLHEGEVINRQPDDWDEEAQGDWYEQPDADDSTPYDHHHDRQMLPRELQGHDIWKVNIDPEHQIVRNDPENALQAAKWNESQWADGTNDPEPSMWEAIHQLNGIGPPRPGLPDPRETEHDDYNHDLATARWMTPQHVAPHQLQLHQHVPLWEHEMYPDNHDWDEERYEHEVPDIWSRVPQYRYFGSWDFQDS